MKLLTIASLFISLNSFAGGFGHNCIPSNKGEEIKLDKVASKLSPNYLGAIKVLVATADQCSFATVGTLKGHCVVNGYDLNIYQGQKAELVISAKTKISLICEEDRSVSI